MKVIHKQENDDESVTTVLEAEGDQVTLVTGKSPILYRREVVAKDRLRETLAMLKKNGIRAELAAEAERIRKVKESMWR